MQCRLKRHRHRCFMIATLLVIACAASSRAFAGKPGLLDFSVNAESEWPSGSNSYTASGAIEDTGWYGVLDEDRYVDENGEIWTRYRFVSSEGTFFIGWLPPDYEPGVQYSVELLAGTGAYSDVQGTATFRQRGHNKYEWRTVGWGQRYRVIISSTEYITVKGTLLP